MEPSDELVLANILPFVSRSGIKLAHALDHFKIDVTGLVAADIGASTGGFTDCLLQRGVQKVYSIDVGTNQLDPSLRDNQKVIVLEQTDVRKAKEKVPELVDLAVVDVSFISLSHIFESIHQLLKPHGRAVLLIKPQFEVGRELVGKKGIVSDTAAHQVAIERLRNDAQKSGFLMHEVIASPITGSTGNTEYLTWVENK